MTNNEQTKTASTAAYKGVIPNKPFGYFLYVTKPYKVWAIAAIVMVVLASGLGQASNYFFKVIVDAVEKNDYHTALLFGLLYPVAVLIIQLMYRISGVLGMKWAVLSRQKGYDDLNEYILAHDSTYFADRFAGSILSKVHNVVKAAEDIVPEFLWTHLNSLTVFIVTFAFIWFVDVVTALLFLSLLVVLFFTNKRFAPGKAILARESAETGTVLRGRMVDTFTNISAVRQYSNKKFELTGLRKLNKKSVGKHQESWLYTEKMLLVNSVILFFFTFGMFWSLTHKWSLGEISAGDFILILSLVSQITGTLLFIGRSFNSTARAIGEIQEGLEDIIIPHGVTDINGATKLKPHGGVVEFEQVNFEFGQNTVFKDFNLNITAGQRVGLVGHSGAGKSTFVSLLLRQHDLDKGAILIDEQNIAEVTQDSLRENISVVPQEPLLFHRSIKENIAYGKPSASRKEIEAVAKKAQAHKFINELSEGYDTLVGERGVKLSGGQKQRVAIARAMLKNAPILVLDEATSALDSESEVEIQKALHQLMVGKTVIAIAHRLSTLREMDRIIVLENGKIVEDGSHDALVKFGGVYAKLWEHQAGGFLKD